jgi:hypothetical protein
MPSTTRPDPLDACAGTAKIAIKQHTVVTVEIERTTEFRSRVRESLTNYILSRVAKSFQSRRQYWAFHKESPSTLPR